MNDSSPCRVLFLEAGSGRGGSSISLCYMLKHLHRDAFDPVVAYYFRNSGPDTQRMRGMGVPVVFLTTRAGPREFGPLRLVMRRSRRRWIRILKLGMRLVLRWTFIDLPILVSLIRLLRRSRIDLVVFNNDVHFHVVGSLAARVTRTPTICRKAGGIGAGTRVKRLLTPWVEVFVAISRATEEDQRTRNRGTRRLVTIPEAVDLDEMSPVRPDPRLRRDLGIPDRWRIVGSLARFQPGKGQRELIEAAPIVLQELPNVAFLLVGDDQEAGAFFASLRARIEALHLEDHIFFPGWRTDVRAILALMDVFVHCPTTWTEALGIGNLEAMAMAKPTVVSRNGGLTDAVIEGVTGFVVPPGDVPAMAERILRLLRDPALAERLGRNARARVEREFNARINTPRFENLLHEFAPAHH